jgi:hypothetical protein
MSSRSAGDFVQQLAALAERLAKRNIVVNCLCCDWASFGNWTIEVSRGADCETYDKALLNHEFIAAAPNVLRCMWDGKDGCLYFETAPTEPLSNPGPWENVNVKEFKSRDAALNFAEEYITKWASSRA